MARAHLLGPAAVGLALPVVGGGDPNGQDGAGLLQTAGGVKGNGEVVVQRQQVVIGQTRPARAQPAS